jgi:molecular chaperone DnaK
MERTTIDYGIDLGTSNSSIAVINGTSTEIIQNQDSSSVVTPSAIWFDKRGNQYVGLKAKNQYFDDQENAAIEFKLQMGEKVQKVFKSTGIKMFPEEMSAEVLKSLKADVQTNKRENLKAAVITVPAAFDAPQTNATRRAGELAGFLQCPLLQEPVAAALAYGFQSKSDKVFWLVYDFGGGTFDAAVIQVRDGIIQVLNHAGDNFLGGKNIDWDIVEKILVPHLLRERQLKHFSRDNHHWNHAFAKLKIFTEEAKIWISRNNKSKEIFISDLCKDDKGDNIDFIYNLKPAELQSITDPWITQSINFCKKTLQDSNLSGKDLEKLILVGGSSLFPWLQERLIAEIGTKIEMSIDPITVVARGAAVFAGTQRIIVVDSKAKIDSWKIQLEFEPIGSDTDPIVGGKIVPPSGNDIAGVTIEILESQSQWRSGLIRLATDGTFATEIHAEKGRKCEFQISLTSAQGSRLNCSPDHFYYTVGMVITAPPLTHNIGIALANNAIQWFFKKGDPLPTSSITKIQKTALILRKRVPDSDENIIRIPLIEGTNDKKADRNSQIGNLEILASDPKVKRDVPLGSDVEISITIDESRQISIKAFIPILNEEFKDITKLDRVSKSPIELKKDFNLAIEELLDLKQQAEAIDVLKAKNEIAKLEKEQKVEIAKRQVDAAQGDEEARLEADKKLIDLNEALDSVQNALEWPKLLKETQIQFENTKEIIMTNGRADEKERYVGLREDVDRAIKYGKNDLLNDILEKLNTLKWEVILRLPEFWIDYLENLKERKVNMGDQQLAERLFEKADQAINDKDFEVLTASVRQLIELLPDIEQEVPKKYGKFKGTLL